MKHSAALVLPTLSFLALPFVTLATTITNPLGNITLCVLIKNVLQAVMTIGVPVAVVLVVYSGFLFVTAQGNEGKVGKARENFFWTVVGIAIFFGAWLIAQIIIGTMQQFGVGITSC